MYFTLCISHPTGAQDLMFPRKRGLINHSPKLLTVSSEEKRRKRNLFIFIYFDYDGVASYNFIANGFVFSCWFSSQVCSDD